MEKASNLLNRVCEAALVLVLGVMAVVVFLQVLFRYVIHLPLFWTEEFARYCLVWASLLGASVALKRGEHIAVTYFMERFPEGLRWVLLLAARISVAAILAVMTWGGVQLVMVTSAQISPALRIPMAVPYLALPFGSAVMLFHTISAMVRRPEEGG
ncbi:MAG: TRAP transporter small permease, partial [Deltaproteobacteria bacterium]|nr:TRAP transporter small permease [Deltaproteobacteria bacterium]